MQAKPVNFVLPAQPAAKALIAFSKQAGVDVLFSFDDLNQVQAAAVAGSYEPAEALTLLLRGTGFSATLKATGKFIVRRDREPPKTSEVRGPALPPATGGAAPQEKGTDDPTSLGPVVALKAYVVTPSRFGIAQERVATNATLTNSELKALPQLGEDLYHTITRLPGLAADDFSAKFWVRGAPNSEILARLDGVDLIEPFHLKDFEGALSIVDLRTIGSIDLVTGGFTTDCGDRLAGVLTMETQEPGVRFDRHASSGDSTWSPRLNASVALGPRTTVRAAWGIYEQAQGLQELSVADGETTFHPSERAEQRVIGISHELESGVGLRLETYERLSSHLRPHGENMLESLMMFPESLYDRIELDPSQGQARGVELTAEHRGKGRFGWGASYAYAVSEERVGDRWIPVSRDQRHTFYVDMTYVPARDWQLSCSWQYHTGWPTTDINYSLVRLNDGSLTYTWAYGPYNSQRAPAYHRLDLRATRTYRLKHSLLRAYLDVFNAYDHRNVDGYDTPSATVVQGRLVVTKNPLRMFSLIPSFGLSWEF